MIGVVADDVTGGTDVAVAFRRQGHKTAIFFDTPSAGELDASLDAAVIALKTRTVSPRSAVAQSIEAARALQHAGATQLYFKYCSTFDSTPAGNIGPVLEALRGLANVDSVVTTPSSPEHGRTTYNGYLFVHDLLLSESHMRNHPLTPMHDSALVRLMDRQLTAPSSTIIGHDTIQVGGEELAAAALEARRTHRYIFPDAITDQDLLAVAAIVLNDPLVGGGAGLASAIARTRHPQHGQGDTVTRTSSGSERSVVLAGSCSRRTLEQIQGLHDAGRPSYRMDALAQQDPDILAQDALDWYDAIPTSDAPLIYSSLPPDALIEVQNKLGVEASAQILEGAIGRVAHGLRKRGVTRFVAAGGETSGSVVAALEITGGEIGDEAARGVPWIHTSDGLDVLLKSGNFGEPDLLVTATKTGAP
ncbi:uncharacterized protein YgbK (DUF1537 family) [Microbacterium sp. BE35]|uniref:3-oxo-tetronate kinase n=1 Tax=Microbacterium sp. BE35 TaxID=2817773 RepID=UPI00285D18A7|nr:3-oxo-tetronate kinase [Microbacterium sp. BE35]MDR7188238.1 uncharacterized protein YgbK (DUF1537 family) [Microbacterium sp. BE35]